MVSEDSAAIRDSVASNADWQFSSIELRSASDESDTSAAAEEEPIRTSSSPNAVLRIRSATTHSSSGRG